MNIQHPWILGGTLVALLGASCRSQPSGSSTNSASTSTTRSTITLPATITTASVSPPPLTHRPPPGRSIFGGTCPGDEVAKCLQRYTKPKLSPADVRRLFDEVDSTCFAQRDPNKLAAQGACLPLTIGEDARNGKSIELIYTCSDVCPQQGGIVIRYVDVAKEACCGLGGYPIRDPAWGGYRGCSPPEMPLPRFYYYHPDGTKGLAVRSPCDPKKIEFVDEDAGP